jgi:lysozyme family protein
MKHFFEDLRPGIEADLRAMIVSPGRGAEVNAVAVKLVRFIDQGRYDRVFRDLGVPVPWMAASFEREASSNFDLSPAQGDPWDEVSEHVPKGRGPYASWTEAADDTYRREGLAEIGSANWTWALAAYYAEYLNGFGYRDYHHVRSPYVWGATNLQQPGKYVADGKFDPDVWDRQIGVAPMMMRLVQLRPALCLPGAWPFGAAKPVADAPSIVPDQTPAAQFDMFAIQRALNADGFGPLLVDGSFGRRTSAALRTFEESKGLQADGLLDRETVDALLG